MAQEVTYQVSDDVSAEAAELLEWVAPWLGRHIGPKFYVLEFTPSIFGDLKPDNKNPFLGRVNWTARLAYMADPASEVKFAVVEGYGGDLTGFQSFRAQQVLGTVPDEWVDPWTPSPLVKEFGARFERPTKPEKPKRSLTAIDLQGPGWERDL